MRTSWSHRGMSTWIFGYGSLIWKPNLPHIEARWALLKGWERRFWQGSPDHRGTPELPGRVLTLRPNPAVSCLGMAYCLDPQHEQATLAQLDHREKAGYDMREVLVHTAQGSHSMDVHRTSRKSSLPGCCVNRRDGPAYRYSYWTQRIQSRLRPQLSPGSRGAAQSERRRRASCAPRRTDQKLSKS